MKLYNNRTKIIATYGPACADKEVMIELIKLGVDVFRFNFSHGDHEYHLRGFELVKELNKEFNLNISILADLQGPKIRVGKVENNGIELIEGEELIITTKESISQKGRIFISYDLLASDVKPGEHLLMDDGKLELEVMSTNGKDEVKAKVVAGGILSSKKGVNLPNTKTSIPALTKEDRINLDFALKNGANWIALSFVRSARDVQELKELIGNSNWQKVIAKIEKPEAVENIESIIAVADAIMVARGDLGVEIPIEKVPLIQKDIINRCIKASVPVIVATQMMESMIENPYPTRAEATDVANAVIDGADAVMLSGETSVGKHPLKVLKIMENILRNVEEADIIYNKEHIAEKKSPTFLSDVMCYNACKIAHDLQAKAILGITRSGYTGFKLSCYRPKSGIYIFTEDHNMLQTLNLLWGVKAFYYDKFVSTDTTISDMIEILRQHGIVHKGDLVVNTASMPLREQLRTNMVKVSVVK